jgi:hypothetical protein
VQPVRSLLTFQGNILPPSSGSKNKWSLLLAPDNYLIRSFFDPQKMKAVCFSETSARFSQTVWLYSLEDSIPHLACYMCVRQSTQ